MKNLRLLLVVFATISLTSCFDIFDTITINEDGSGIYEQKIDMSKAFEMMNGMGDNKTPKGVKEKFDSSFSFKDVTDTLTQLSIEEKMIFAKANAKIIIDENSNIGFVLMRFPFTNATEFQILQKVLDRDDTQANIYGSIMKSFGQNKSSELENSNVGGMPKKDIRYILTENSFSSKTNANKSIANTQQTLSGLPSNMLEMMKMKLTLTINLPRPITSNNSSYGKVTNDKKKIEFMKMVNLEDTFSSSEFNFKIEF